MRRPGEIEPFERVYDDEFVRLNRVIGVEPEDLRVIAERASELIREDPDFAAVTSPAVDNLVRLYDTPENAFRRLSFAQVNRRVVDVYVGSGTATGDMVAIAERFPSASLVGTLADDEETVIGLEGAERGIQRAFSPRTVPDHLNVLTSTIIGLTQQAPTPQNAHMLEYTAHVPVELEVAYAQAGFVPRYIGTLAVTREPNAHIELTPEESVWFGREM